MNVLDGSLTGHRAEIRLSAPSGTGTRTNGCLCSGMGNSAVHVAEKDYQSHHWILSIKERKACEHATQQMNVPRLSVMRLIRNVTPARIKRRGIHS